MDLAYFPAERGTNNYDDSFGRMGNISILEDRWGCITRALTTTNFQQANIEYIQFWLMDPYENYSIKPEEGGPVTPPSLQDMQGELYFTFLEIFQKIF